MENRVRITYRDLESNGATACTRSVPATTQRDDLLRPQAYAAVAPTRSVSIFETHISWVFVLDRDVFKVKKPVDLGFLDFRTIEQRRHACEEEVRLNARLAPGVYRGVVPVTRGLDGRCALAGTGRIVDWAVHMARLPDEKRADVLLERGELTTDAVDAIASSIASFHESARGDDTLRYGRTSTVETNTLENFHQTEDTLPQYLSPAESAEVVRWQSAFVHDEHARFERRAAAGRVREGHGDLRLEHVYLEPRGGIRVLDCIEFNERFRYGDVCSDIAFLSMDFAAHGRVDLAERLLATYARESNDFDLYSVVDFYEGYRAFVRGKIASMLASDGAADPAARRRAEQEARRYFLLALASERPSLLPPSVVAVGGLMGAGKSAIADRLALQRSAPVVDADRTRKALLAVDPRAPLEDPAWTGAYDPEMSERVYIEIFRRAGVVLASGRPVILDASFRSAALRGAARDLARAHGVPFRFVECVASPDLCRARLETRARQANVSDGRVAIFDAFRARYEPCDPAREFAPGEHLVLDTSGPLPESFEPLRRSLETWPCGLVG